MSSSFGKITAVLDEPIDKVSEELVTLINKYIKPPEPVTSNDIYVRTMQVVSDEINSFGGRFPADEHPRLASLLIDSPVLIGHRKDKLPIGRNFHTVFINRDGRQWIKSYFYWLKSAAGSESLRENIDGGIYKECSIGFTYLFPECSVCGDDIRRCDHQPLQRFINGGVESVTHFNYRKIERVLETSLVYRGALPDTRVTKDLNELGQSFSQFLNEEYKLNTAAYLLEKYPYSDHARLTISGGDKSIQLLLRQFNINRLNKGIRFQAELNKTIAPLSGAIVFGQGGVATSKIIGGSLVFELSGSLSGQFILERANIEGQKTFLFSKVREPIESTSLTPELAGNTNQ